MEPLLPCSAMASVEAFVAAARPVSGHGDRPVADSPMRFAASTEGVAPTF